MLCSTESKPKEELGKNAYKQMFLSPQIDSIPRNFYNDPVVESRPLDLRNNRQLGCQHSKSVSGSQFEQNRPTFLSMPYAKGSKLGEMVTSGE